MIPLIRAFIWMRFRTQLNTLRSGNRRGNFESFSRFLEAAAPILLVLVVAPASFAVALGAFYAGRLLAAPAPNPELARIVFLAARGVLAIVLAMTIFSPLIGSQKTVGSGLVRLLLLPIPRRGLYLVQVASAIGDPVIFGVTPGLAALCLGLTLGGRSGSALTMALAGVLLIVVLTALTSLTGWAAQLVMRDRRRAEIASMAVITLITFGSLIPALWLDENVDQTFIRNLKGLLILVPSELYAESLRFVLEGSTGDLVRALSVLAMMAGALLYLGSKAHQRLLENPERSGPSKKKAVRRDTGRIYPGLSPAASSVVRLYLRHVVRSVRGRMALLLGPLTIPVMGLAFSSSGAGEFFQWVPLGQGLPLALMAVGLSQLAFQPVQANLFGCDGPGLSLLFLAPLSDKDLLKGKLVAGGALSMATAALGLAGAFVVVRSGSLQFWLLFLPIALVAYLVAGPCLALLSIYFPKATNLASWGKEGNPHPWAALLSTLFIPAALALPIAPAAATFLLTASISLTWASLLVSGTLAAFVARGVFAIAVAQLTARRETLHLVSQGR